MDTFMVYVEIKYIYIFIKNIFIKIYFATIASILA